MKAVLFLSGETMGDALGGAGRLWAPMFEHLGYKFIEVRLGAPDGISFLNSAVNAHQIEAVISFVGMAAELKGTTAEGKELNYWQGRNIPFVSIYGDTPAYFFDRHLLPGKGFASLYAFPEHCAVRKRLPKATGLLATIPPLVVDARCKDEINFFAKERGKLLFLKNGNDPNNLLRMWSESLSDRMYEMLSDLACELAGDLDSEKCNDIDGLVCDYFRTRSLDIEDLLNVRLFFVAQLDDYCRRLKSTMIAEALLDFPVEVHGFNWEHLEFRGKRAKLVPHANFDVSRTLIEQSLGLIDMSPNTGLAPHERSRRAFGAYTLCLTNDQAYFRETFKEANRFSFKFNVGSIRALVEDVLGHPKRHVELGIELSESFLASQTCPDLATYLLNVASLLRLETSARSPNLQNYFAWPVTRLA